MKTEIRDYLQTCLFTSEITERIVALTDSNGVHPNRGWVYDAELGFVHVRSIHSGNGVNGTNTYCDYEKDGARRLINFTDRPCRLHTYGNSFTHCNQVNNGETWQEYLAAHLGEPIRNYGVGGCSVYQAYRRMRKVHRNGARAKNIILNIYDDDHYRNLISWCRPPFTSHNPGPNIPPRPYLGIDVGGNSFTEHDNPIATADELHQLCDLEFVCATFGEDPLVYLGTAMMNKGEKAVAFIEGACERFGLQVPAGAADDIEKVARDVFTEAALFSTRHVVELVERFCEKNGIELMFVLSYRGSSTSRNPCSIRSMLDGGERFDQEFVDWLTERQYPVVDMYQAFKTEFEYSAMDLDAFVKRYYIGHHTPYGNFITAWTLMDTVVDWLNPKPPPYQRDLY